MKKILFVASLLVAGQAYAVENVYRPYFGIDYAYSKVDAKNRSPELNSAAVSFGSEYNKYFGTELWYQKSLTATTKREDSKTKSSFHAFGLDMYAYAPMFCDQKFAPLATFRVGRYAAKKKVDGYKSNDDDGAGYRFGAGAQYLIDEHLSVRALFRYVKLDRLADVDHINEVAAGIRYTF